MALFWHDAAVTDFKMPFLSHCCRRTRRPALWLATALMWAVAGAHASGAGVAESPAEPRPPLWSVQPIRPVPIPTVSATPTVQTPIDAFVEAGLRQRGLKAGPLASRATRIRRVTLDLVGIPPTPEEVTAFEQDGSANAWDRVVDRLLASPRYGERWARHWLDLARYAESEGFKADETRPNAWRYRDYVVRSLNADKPYDRFVQEQIAGDELWPGNLEALIATGFNRHYPDESNARNLMQRRQEILNDITDTVGSVFLGLTVACARCHDHKFDPISQADYFKLQAFFANSAANDQAVLVSDGDLREYHQRLTVWENKTQGIREEMERLEAPQRTAILQDYVEKYPENIQVALRKPAGDRTAFEHQMVAKARLYLDPESHQYLAPPSACSSRMKKEEKARWQELKKQLDQFAGEHPGKLPRAAAVTDVANEVPPTHILGRGNWNSPRDEVMPGFPSVLGLPDPEILPVLLGTPQASANVMGSDLAFTNSRRSSGRRSALARWLTDASNPLVSRVLVNRIWQHHFGQGLVRTPGDFGFKGEAPSHPELLDWLASDFMRTGWSLKSLHRLIVRSAVYQRQSARSPDSAAESGDASMASVANLDPGNRYLAVFPRTRLEGEVIRDSALAVSGRLNSEMGGPSVFPELPPGMETRGGWKISSELGAPDRRSVYVFVRRNTRYPMFETFDMPDTHETCSRRNITTSPVQALTLLNSRLTHEWAQGFAGRVVEAVGTTMDRQIEQAWQLAYGRSADTEELELSRKFLVEHRRILAERRQRGEPLALPSPGGNRMDPDQGAALVDFCHALLNSNEFVYRE